MQLDREAKERSLESVLKSRTFSRSEQLQVFLKYICELELAGRGDEISEYSIATGALNRPSNYAPGEDSSVRSRAHALRRKLKEFYETEAADSETLIELPKGSYRPLFLLRADSMPETPPPPAPSPPRKSIFSNVVMPAAFLILAAVGLLLWQARQDPVDPLIREAWGPSLTRGADSLIVLS